jgi:hypothetical protein
VLVRLATSQLAWLPWPQEVQAKRAAVPQPETRAVDVAVVPGQEGGRTWVCAPSAASARCLAASTSPVHKTSQDNTEDGSHFESLICLIGTHGISCRVRFSSPRSTSNQATPGGNSKRHGRESSPAPNSTTCSARTRGALHSARLPQAMSPHTMQALLHHMHFVFAAGVDQGACPG